MSKKKGKHAHRQLTALTVRNLTRPGRYADGNGLYLVVDPSGAKRWLLRTVIHGKRRDMGLGGLELVSLSEAREKAAKYRKEAREGGDPIATRRAEYKVAPTFEELARKLYKALLPSWSNPKHASQWINTLEQYVFPHIGAIRVDQITPDDVTRVLLPIWHDRPVTARRVRQRIRLVMDSAVESRHRTDNPALVKVSLPRQVKRRAHHAAMPYVDIPAFMTRLRQVNGEVSAKLAVEFAILTAARTNEVRGATWAEIDMDAACWTIPAERMKAKLPHRVPLSGRALAILKEAERISDGGGYVFPGRKAGKPIGQTAAWDLLRRMNVDATIHGFRSSFRDWCEERTNFPNNVCESALAHTVKNQAEAAYRRTDHFDQRRDLMAAWAQFVTGGTAQIVPLRKA